MDTIKYDLRFRIVAINTFTILLKSATLNPYALYNKLVNVCDETSPLFYLVYNVHFKLIAFPLSPPSHLSPTGRCDDEATALQLTHHRLHADDYCPPSVDYKVPNGVPYIGGKRYSGVSKRLNSKPD